MSSAELARHRDQQRARYAAIAVAALAITSSLTLVLGLASPAQSPARLDVLAAAVELKSPGETEFRSVAASTDLAAGSAIRTSRTGFAEVAFGDGSLTRVGPDTTYSLKTLEIGPDTRQIVGRLDVGRTFHRVSKVTGSESRFEVQTSNAVAAVRGTAFSVQCVKANNCEVAVTEGTVAVTGRGGVSVDVTAGRRIVIGGQGELGPLQEIPPTDPWIELNTEASDESSASTTSPTGQSATPDETSGTTETTPGPSSLEPASSSAPGPVPTAPSVPGVSPTGANHTSVPTSGGSNSTIPSTTRPTTTRPTTSGPTTSRPSTTTSLSVPGTGEVPVPTTVPIDPSVICPGYQGEPQRGAVDGEPGTCVPCEVGQTVPNNPNCAATNR